MGRLCLEFEHFSLSLPPPGAPWLGGGGFSSRALLRAPSPDLAPCFYNETHSGQETHKNYRKKHTAVQYRAVSLRASIMLTPSPPPPLAMQDQQRSPYLPAMEMRASMRPSSLDLSAPYVFLCCSRTPPAVSAAISLSRPHLRVGTAHSTEAFPLTFLSSNGVVRLRFAILTRGPYLDRVRYFPLCISNHRRACHATLRSLVAAETEKFDAQSWLPGLVKGTKGADPRMMP